MNKVAKMLVCSAFVMTVLLVAGISGGETATSPLNGSVSFTSASAAQDTLKVNAGTKTVKATDAVKVQGHPNSEITVVSTPGTGSVHVATVTLREGDSLYHVEGLYVGGGGTGGTGGGTVTTWDAEYDEGLSGRVRITRVPQYLYADATAWAPVKFKIIGFGEGAKVELSSVEVVLIYG